MNQANVHVLLALLVSFSLSMAHAAGATAAPRSRLPEVCRLVEATNHWTLLKPTCVATESAVDTVRGHIEYTAVAGSLVVHPAGWDDAAPAAGTPEAALSYVAYFRKPLTQTRPIMFLYNGGPGTPTMWLHMGAFGPRRAIFDAAANTSDRVYSIAPNRFALLDTADLVFIDAPGTGFGRLAGEGKEKAFWGTDADASAFAQFIKTFLSLHGRWESPKYLFGESYGTLRSAVLIHRLERDNVRFNGVLLMSQILELGNSTFFAAANPGMVQPYALAVPSYAAAAWYHKKASGSSAGNLPHLLAEVERFVDTDYLPALLLGADLDSSRKRSIAERLAGYTGLPVDYLLKADLRISGPQFAQALLHDGRMIGQLDARLVAPAVDPLRKEAAFDPTMRYLAPIYFQASKAYLYNELRLDRGVEYRGLISVDGQWDFAHNPGEGLWSPGGRASAIADLAAAMLANPHLKVAVFSGYYDLNTPYYQARFELRHLPIPPELRANIQQHLYEAGHMIYADEPSLARLYDDVSEFVRSTSSIHAPR